jgi:hypothetical protein
VVGEVIVVEVVVVELATVVVIVLAPSPAIVLTTVDKAIVERVVRVA